MVRIGAKLLQLRHKMAYTQDYVADQLGVAQSTYSRFESDEVQPKCDLLPKIAKLYNVPIQELFSSGEGGYVNISQYSDQSYSAYQVYSDQSFSAYQVYQDSQQHMEKLLASKDEIIALLRAQIDLLQEELRRLRSSS
jgi:transcriptional regulator with XRE-family HTH domain